MFSGANRGLHTSSFRSPFVGSLEILSPVLLTWMIYSFMTCHFFLLWLLGIQQHFSFSLLKTDGPSWWPYWKVPDILFFFFKMALIWFTGNIHESFAPKKVKLIIASFQLTCQQQAASSYFTLYIFQTSQFCLSPQPAVYCRAQIFSALTSFLEVPLLTQDGWRMFLPPEMFMYLG